MGAPKPFPAETSRKMTRMSDIDRKTSIIPANSSGVLAARNVDLLTVVVLQTDIFSPFERTLWFRN
jgi:hypothetical protein